MNNICRTYYYVDRETKKIIVQLEGLYGVEEKAYIY